MNRSRATVALSACLLVAGVAGAAEREPPKRAARPRFASDASDVFFDDAREQLVGARPESAVPAAGPPSAAASAAATAPTDRFRWSAFISGETIADEIKRLANGLRAPLANLGKFRSGGCQQCRANFSLLAVLFGVTAEFDGEVRFQRDATTLRDLFARAAANCKVATEASFNEARQRQLDLDEVLRGQSVAGAAGGPRPWSELADRTALMQQMEAALDESIMPALANDRTFGRQHLDVQREAQLLAMLAEVIQREDYDYREEEDYAGPAQQLKEASVAMTRAAAEENYEAAREAAGRAAQACTICHETYRG